MGDKEMPYAGIASFLKAPFVPSPTKDLGDVAVLGVPYDEGTTSRSGARMGPRALREASTNWAYRDGVEPFWDGEVGVELLGAVRWVDCGDVALAPTWPHEKRHRAVVERLQPIVEAGLFPVVLGGDHSIAYPAVKAVCQALGGQPLQLVQFDAHMDYWDEESGQRFTHASPVIRAHEDGLLSGVTQYGIRGLHTHSDNIALARRRGLRTFWCERSKDTRTAELVDHLAPGADVYVTFDVDALDPAIAPGTGTPEPGGLSYYEAKAILLAVCARCNVVGMDLVEVAPVYDGPGQVTALHAARLILDTVGATFRRRTQLG
jgi:agmatinase